MRTLLSFALLFAFLAIQGCKQTNMQNNDAYLFIGTYTTDNQSQGIYVYKFNDADGSMTEVSHTDHVVNPSYLALPQNEQYLYAVNENTSSATKGMVSAFAFDSASGQLRFLNSQPTNGDAPCYIAIDSLGKNVAVANYNGGNFSVFKTDTSGKLWPASQIIAHTGSSTNKKIQTQSHVHSTIFSPDEKYLFVCDLGNDTLYQYLFNNKNLLPVDTNAVVKYKVPNGFGPRHIAFSPNGKYAYLLNELDAQVIAYAWQNDSLKQLQIIASTTIEDTASGDKGSAAIRISPNGNFLYTSNRGNANDITIFKINTDGTLTEVVHQPTDKHPRDFAITPSGKYLLVASRDDNNVKVYAIDQSTGLLTYTNQEIKLPKPVALLFAPIK